MNSDPNLETVTSYEELTNPCLYPWDRGPAVAELQELLTAHGFRLVVDGCFGSKTEAAVKSFQDQHGLRMDGVVGATTWTLLKQTVVVGSRKLQRGHTGADVRELQGLLQIYGLTVPRSGVFNRQTEEAVHAFQERQKLKADGIVDSITWTTLRQGQPLPQQPKQSGWFINNRRWW
ncbi:hypothetical protein BST81_25515 [Leptolyngbya sp. 'hensonii']|uniref:peptidoglycan-binding domain-containing protein n=1 Tax=Leptolyngbya sp. 'hensonii' TaxID=1922337 RepID=UPI00094FFF4E|nr:peptidoglycan-binding protein [Leptolyngbya sp. 'hensonii']OLP15569.1 hypothetical protein BST81_25515 [Leptolyngbya sp. 'hensonii']